MKYRITTRNAYRTNGSLIELVGTAKNEREAKAHFRHALKAAPGLDLVLELTRQRAPRGERATFLRTNLHMQFDRHSV